MPGNLLQRYVMNMERIEAYKVLQAGHSARLGAMTVKGVKEWVRAWSKRARKTATHASLTWNGKAIGTEGLGGALRRTFGNMFQQ